MLDILPLSKGIFKLKAKIHHPLKRHKGYVNSNINVYKNIVKSQFSYPNETFLFNGCEITNMQQLYYYFHQSFSTHLRRGGKIVHTFHSPTFLWYIQKDLKLLKAFTAHSTYLTSKLTVVQKSCILYMIPGKVNISHGFALP